MKWLASHQWIVPVILTGTVLAVFVFFCVTAKTGDEAMALGILMVIGIQAILIIWFGYGTYHLLRFLWKFVTG